MSHIIGRPNDDVLEVMLGHGADPEQAFIRGSQSGAEETTGSSSALAATSAPSPGKPPEEG